MPARPPLLTVAPQEPGDVDTSTGELGVPAQATVTGGGVMVTENVVCDWLFEWSVAVHVTVVLPMGTTPRRGTQTA